MTLFNVMMCDVVSCNVMPCNIMSWDVMVCSVMLSSGSDRKSTSSAERRIAWGACLRASAYVTACVLQCFRV